MAQLVLKILTGLAAKLLTEKLLMEVVLILVGRLVKSTKNDLDDQLFEQIEKAIRGEKDKECK